MADLHLYNKAVNSEETAPLYDSKTPWENIFARLIPIEYNDSTLYAGAINSSNDSGYTKTLYGKVQIPSDTESYSILKTANLIPSSLESKTGHYKDVSNYNFNGCLLVGNPFIMNESKEVTITVTFTASGSASASWDWCWTGIGFSILEEKYMEGLTPNVWSVYSCGYNSGGKIVANGNYAWSSYYDGHGSRDGFSGKVFYCANASSGSFSRNNTTFSSKITLPKGKSSLAIVYCITASNGDGASINFSNCSASISY